MNKLSYVYILTNKSKTVLYIGVTSNLERRIHEHKFGLRGGFTKKYNIKHLIYFEEFINITDAIFREKSLKGKSRLKKETLITRTNPKWLELLT